MEKKQRNGWIVLAALYYYSIIAAFNLLKAPPLFGLLMDEFMLTESTVGFIVSASSIAGLILVFPSAIIARKLGTRRCGQIAICCSVTGCIIGALAPSLPVLLVGRFVEGCGLGMTGVVGSTTIPQYFKGKKMGLPMAIWSTWFAVGSALGSLLSGRIGHGFENWRASWWTGAILAAVGFVIFTLLVHENKGGAPDHAPTPEPVRLPGEKKVSDFGLGIKNLRIWCIGLFFATLLASCVGFLSFGTEFFSAQFGMEKADASALASLGYWFTVVGGVAAGVVSRLRKSNSMKGQFVQMILCALACMAVYPFGFLVPRDMMVFYLFLCGLVNGYTCGVVFGTVPRLVHKPQVTGVSMGIIFVCQNISSFSASPLVGACVEGGNWSGAVIPLLCVTGVGLIFCIAAAVLEGRRQKKLNALEAAEQREQGELAAMQEEKNILMQEKDALQVSVQQAKEEIESLQAENDRLRQAIIQVRADLERMREENRTELEKTRADVETARAEAERRLSEVKAAESRELLARAELEKLRVRLEELKKMSPVKRLFWKG